MLHKIYFDNSITSWPKAPGMAKAMSTLIESGAFNINRGNYEGAYEIESLVLDTRRQLASLFHAPNSKCVIFTPGITYSLNYFVKGFLKPGDHVLISGLEHNAVMRPLTQMEHLGVSWTTIKTNSDGTISSEDVENAIQKNTRAVLMLHASNVCGTILPILEIGELCHRHHLFFALDTAQSAGSIPINMVDCHVDFLCFTGHKGLLGPQGIGGFLISDRLDQIMEPLITGGTGSQSDSFSAPSRQLPDLPVNVAEYHCW